MRPTYPRIAAGLLALAALGFHSVRASAPEARIIESLDQGWRFVKADLPAAKETSFDDSSWTKVDVPHDWSVEGPFSETNPSGGAGAFLPSGVSWYRRTLDVPAAWANRRIRIEFDGVMAHSQVWINGYRLGERPYGYESFTYDLTGHVTPGSTNVIAVRTDTSEQPSSRWYSGAGIYRHVRLVSTSPLFVAPWGAFVATPVATADRAEVSVQVEVSNSESLPRQPRVVVDLYDPTGNRVAGEWSRAEEVPGNSTRTYTVRLSLSKPRLWSLDSPALYQARVSVREGRSVADSVEIPFGIRDAHFEPASGFWLNGRNLKLKGVCLHNDASAVGIAVPLSLWEYRLLALKKLGVNAIRTAHNPPAPEFLDLCDRLGFLVMDEMFDCWTVAKNPYDYHRDFEAWSVADTEATVRRDRNHPSVILYSAGNEIHDTPQAEHSKAILRSLVAAFHRNDPTRPVTQGLFRPNVSHDYEDGLADMLDVIGTNYRFNELIAAHVDKPSRMIVGTENGHEIRAWIAVRDVPSYSGEFIWTGIDYLGESERWPQIASGSGLLDRIGDARPVGRQFESWWSAKPMVALYRRIAPTAAVPTDPGFHAVRRRTVLFADWSPDDRSAHVETVEVYSNCESVELYLNGKSLGVKERPAAPAPQPESAWVKARRDDSSSSDPDAPRQWKVPFEPGELLAVARNQGHEASRSLLRTAGPAARLRIDASRTQIGTGWDHVGIATVTVVDANDTPVPGAANPVVFSVSHARLVAVDSADNASHEPFTGTARRSAYEGRCQALVRIESGEESATLTASSPGLEPASVTFTR